MSASKPFPIFGHKRPDESKVRPDRRRAYTQDGAFAAIALTRCSGDATIVNVATRDPGGTHPNAVAAAFAGTIRYAAGNGSGNLTVS